MMYDNHNKMMHDNHNKITEGGNLESQKVTAKIIAEQLGLSIATVDRALNNRGNVKEETYRKIMEKTKELGYTPNKLASFLSKKKQYNIAVIFPKYPQYFWEQIEVGISQAYRELGDFGLAIETFRIPEKDSLDAVELVKQIIDSKKFEAIALAAGDDIFADVIDYGIDKGIPICTFNNDSPESKRLFYIGSDYRNAGRLAAELLCKFIGMSGKVAILIGHNLDYQAREKMAGFQEVLNEYPDVEVIGHLKLTLEDVQEGFFNKLQSNLSSPDGIYIANAELGNVAKYLEQINIERKVTLIGHDMNSDIYHYLNRGFISATIGQDPVSQGYLTIKKLFGYLAHEEGIDKKEVITKLEIITKENAKFYV